MTDTAPVPLCHLGQISKVGGEHSSGVKNPIPLPTLNANSSSATHWPCDLRKVT